MISTAKQEFVSTSVDGCIHAPADPRVDFEGVEQLFAAQTAGTGHRGQAAVQFGIELTIRVEIDAVAVV